MAPARSAVLGARSTAGLASAWARTCSA